MKKVTLILAIAFGFLTSQAQVVYDYLKSADAYYAKADYASAALYYERYLGLNNDKVKGDAYDPYTVVSLSKKQKIAVSNRQQAIYRIAESYRLLNYHIKAGPYYAQAAAFDSTVFPLANYWYGKTLRALAKYDSAEIAFNHFIAIHAASDSYKEDANREVGNLRFIQAQLKKKDLGLYTVTKAASMLNTNGASYAPVWINKNALVFTSTRPDTASASSKTKAYTNRIYLASYSDGVVSSVEKTDLPQVTDVHQGVVSFTPDANTIFLTRWTIMNGKKNALIYTSKKLNGTWGNPVLLDSNTINIAGSSTQQPFVMPDGKHLLFASDRPGGLGGFDIWSVDLDAAGNVTGTPTNLGAPVNSKYDEQAPYYHKPTASLIFSSNGNIGMGGFDFFQSKGNIGSWGNPENLGYPLNSVKDDIYFVSKGTEKNILADVMFSSDRSSACCLEMFTLNKVRPLKQISGTVVDCEDSKPLPWVNLTVTNEANQIIETRSTGMDGRYSFELDEFLSMNITAKAEGYTDASISAKGESNNELVSQSLQTICLNKIKFDTIPPPPAVDTVVVMNNIYFDFDRAVILPQSYEYIDAQILAMLKRYPTMVIQISGHTDNLGNDQYNLELSQARAMAVKYYLEAKGIAAERLQAIGLGETVPIAPNEINGKDNPEGRKKNRRTEFKVLHY